MPIIVTEQIGRTTDNDQGMQYRFISCPYCRRPQIFRFNSTQYCQDCNKPIIDGLKLMHNLKYRVAYHLGIIGSSGVWLRQ